MSVLLGIEFEHYAEFYSSPWCIEHARKYRPVKKCSDLQRNIEKSYEFARHKAFSKDINEIENLQIEILVENLEFSVRENRLEEAFQGLRLLSYRYGVERADGIPARYEDISDILNIKNESLKNLLLNIFPKEFFDQFRELVRAQQSCPHFKRFKDKKWLEDTFECRYPSLKNLQKINMHPELN